MKRILLFLFFIPFLLSGQNSYTINTVGMTFTPDTVTINLGDTVEFGPLGYHNAVEVDESTWTANDTTYNGGFSFALGSPGGYFIADSAKTYYYVCQPHAPMGMKGVIIANAIPIFGCTDSSAYNYDSTAVIDDGSCTYPAANLYFSEYAEGSSNNKYFEVYNASNDTVDLTAYAYPSVGNAPSTVGVYEYWNDFDAGASVAPGDVYIVAHPYADPTILAEADETHTYLSNGDDGYALVYGSDPGSPMGPTSGGYVIIDWLGDWDGDPGSGWSVAGVSNGTQNHTLVRKCSVTQGNTNWILSAGTNTNDSEWEVFPSNTWTYIGSHTTPCPPVPGCTDSTATNYNPLATVDDGSCLYGMPGCTDSTALNYNSAAIVDDGSCLYCVYGCMDTLAVNYSSSATCDDGSCLYGVAGCTDSTALNYNPLATFDNGSCTYPAANLYFSEYAEGSSNNKYFEVYNASNNIVDLTAYAYPSVSNAPTTVGVYEYWNAFDAGAVVAPGDVYIVAHPSADPTILAEADETHPYLSNGDDGYALVHGDQSSYIVLDWLGDWDGDPGSGWSVAGVSNATKDHTLVRKCSVTQGNTNWILSAGTNTNDSEWEVLPQNTWTYLGSHTTPCPPVPGCTDSTATNYNPLATVDDGSCLYGMPGCTDSTALNYNPLATVDDSSCVYCVYGCMDTLAVNYSSSAICDDGSCLYGVAGCTDSTALNYNPLATFDDGSCVYCVYGCMDTLAVNYSSSATCDDGSCLYGVAGCTDSTATNYNANANIDDGSCTYPAANLYFSEYAEGSSNNKYFEVYNASNNIVDLTAYAYPSVSNAPTTVGVYEYWNAFDAGAVVAPGDVYIVAHPSADPTILAEADETHPYLSNGDDGYALVHGDQSSYIVLDWLGDWDGDPGSGWSVAGVSNATKDHTLVRKCSVTQGNTNWILSAGTNTNDSEWEVLPQNTWTYLGSHTTPCPPVPGCTDSTATNYNPLATVDDGSCLYGMPGCTDSTALNYNPLATVDDSSCVYCVYGCMDTTQFNYNPLATCDDGTCTPIIYGCTDSTAINYYSAANTNNGTCVYCTYGCTDPLATNYNSSATCDDGSCTYPASCNNPTPTGLSVTDLTHDRAKVNWVDVNTSVCLVEMYRVQYRELGTTAWSTKTALGSGLCNFGLTTTSKMLWNLTPSTTYEYRAKAWYCSASASSFSSLSTFTTLDPCPNVLNLAVSSGSNTQATFSWTAPTAPYSFVRIKLRVDSVGSAWFTAGGFGVMYPALTRNKNGLTPGQTYRASSRTWCNPSGGAHKALAWTPFVFWTQPGTLIRIEDENSTAITNLEVYPNPSRDIFNVSFVSDEVQNLSISIINVVGEAVYTADLDQFVGQFTKEVSLATYPKGVYFLEITTDKGVINKKLILQ